MTKTLDELLLLLFNIKLVQQYTRKEKEEKRKNNKRKHTHTEITIKPE